jgi:hypothetical protein
MSLGLYPQRPPNIFKVFKFSNNRRFFQERRACELSAPYETLRPLYGIRNRGRTAWSPVNVWFGSLSAFGTNLVASLVSSASSTPRRLAGDQGNS